MLIIEDERILMTRGDSAVLSFALEDCNGEPYEMAQGDELTFTVRRAPGIGPALLLIASAPGSGRIVIHPGDTAGLDIGAYSCEAVLRTQSGEKYTVFPKNEGIHRLCPLNTKNFNIMPEVG